MSIAQAAQKTGSSEGLQALQMSVFASVQSTGSFQDRRVTRAELAEEIKNPKEYSSKAELPLLKLAAFGNKRNHKGSLRHDGNVELVFGVEGDYDDGEVSVEEAERRLRGAGVGALICTTPSHTTARPRWRVLALLNRPVPAEARAHHVSLLNDALDGILAPESWKVSQVFYFGKVAGVPYEVREVEGEALDFLGDAGLLVPREPAQRAAAAKAISKPRAMRDIDDPVVDYLEEAGWIKGYAADGVVHVRCPWEDEHTTPSTDSSTAYLPAGVGGEALGGFKCLHGHCSGRKVFDFLRAVGYDDPAQEFDVVTPEAAKAAHAAIDRAKTPRFVCVPDHLFASGSPPAWIVKGLLPQAELAVVYGESGSGKSFWVLDLCMHIARGVDYRDRRVRQGAVLYIAAEGAGGFRKRLQACRQRYQLGETPLPFSVIAGAPNLLADDDKAVAEAVLAAGGADVIVIDTLAQVTPGANENAGQDMGAVLAHCKRLHAATGALVLLVHHSGKDAARGARGWSGIRAAVDAEIEVVRDGEARAARVTKQKDGEDSDVIPFRLVPIMVGVDDDGDEITSCVVEAAEFSSAPARRPQGRVQQFVLSAVHQLAGAQLSRVPIGTLLEVAVAGLPAPSGDRDRRREHVMRAVSALIEAAFFRRDGDDLLLPQSSDCLKSEFEDLRRSTSDAPISPNPYRDGELGRGARQAEDGLATPQALQETTPAAASPHARITNPQEITR